MSSPNDNDGRIVGSSLLFCIFERRPLELPSVVSLLAPETKPLILEGLVG
jgi:hypothetical protein